MATNKTIEEKIAEGRQYRSIDLTEFEHRSEEDGQIVEGYATTFNQPYVLWRDDDFTFREQVDPAAFEEADMSDVIMQYDHAGRVFARISNGTLEVTPDEHGLRIRANLGGTEIGRQLYEEIDGGYTNKMSFGFTVEEDRLDREDKEVLRTITKIGKLYDVSAVSLPANDATTISARSYCEGVIAEIREELAKREEEERARQEKIKRLKLLTEY
jgi:hypothetical protein